jgi:hypothetical protein
MKKLINLMIVILGAAFLASCASSGRMMDRAAGYGYYDNMYYHGSPGYYGANTYLYQRPIVIQRDMIVVPEKKKVRKRNTVERRTRVAPESRRRVIQNESSRSVNRSTTPTRRNDRVAPASRSTSPPATRGASRAGSRRGGNQ